MSVSTVLVVTAESMSFVRPSQNPTCLLESKGYAPGSIFIPTLLERANKIMIIQDK
jgi:hypothetical protein